MGPVAEVETDLNQVIVSAINARIEAAVTQALAGKGYGIQVSLRTGD